MCSDKISTLPFEILEITTFLDAFQLNTSEYMLLPVKISLAPREVHYIYFGYGDVAIWKGKDFQGFHICYKVGHNFF